MKQDELIMRLHDGELEPSELAQGEALSKDPEASAKLHELQELGVLIRQIEAHRAPTPDLSSAILARVLAEPSPADEVAEKPSSRDGVLAGQPFGRAEAPRAAAKARGWGLAAAGLALAAMFALFVTSLKEPQQSVVQATASPKAPAPLRSGALASNDADRQEERSVSVESVDFGSNQGAIFMVSEGAADTLVIWTLDEPEDKRRKANL